jgi:hypothetical protein
MAGACGRTYRVDPRLDPAPCNALVPTASGLLVPSTVIGARPGISITAPAAGDCPQTWQVGIDASWAQSVWNPAPGGLHALTGADRVYEQVTEMTTITIPRAGVWEVDYQVRGVVFLPANSASAMFVTAAIFKNGAITSGSEAMITGISVGGGATPASTAQNTGGQTYLDVFAAGDLVTLHAYRIGQSGTASVVSNADGRSRIMAHWLGPTGDTPA